MAEKIAWQKSSGNLIFLLLDHEAQLIFLAKNKNKNRNGFLFPVSSSHLRTVTYPLAIHVHLCEVLNDWKNLINLEPGT